MRPYCEETRRTNPNYDYRQYPAEPACLSSLDVAIRAQREFWRRSSELGDCLCGPKVVFHNEVFVSYSKRDILGVFIQGPNTPSTETLTRAARAAEAAGRVPIVRLHGQPIPRAGRVGTNELPSPVAGYPGCRNSNVPAAPWLVSSTSQERSTARTTPPPDLRDCLSRMSEAQTSSYLVSVYGSVAPTVAEWTWRDADVIWLDKLDPSTLSCLLDGRAPGTPGVWTAHQARGFYLPPIGAKMEMPVIWQFHEHRSCAGEKFEYGGNRAAPTEEDDAGWAEVFHYNRPLNDRFESAHVWLYRARGTGVFYRMGRTITFHDTIDLSHYLSSKFNVLSSVKGFGKAALVDVAVKLLRDRFDTLAFSHHVDLGFAGRATCEPPRVGWDANYYYLSEIVVLREPSSDARFRRRSSCPPIPLYGGWPSTTTGASHTSSTLSGSGRNAPLANPRWPCECDASALDTSPAQRPQLPEDKRWQLGVVRCMIPA